MRTIKFHLYVRMCWVYSHVYISGSNLMCLNIEIKRNIQF